MVSTSPAALQTDFAGPDIDPPRPGRPRRTFARVLLGAVAALLVALAVYAAFLYGSVLRLQATAEGLEDAAVGLELSVAREDWSGVLTSTEAIRGGLAGLSAELSRWEWEVARHIPVYGPDVDTARRLLAIADDFMASTVDPVTDVLERALKLPEGFDGLVEGVALFDEAAGVVGAASAAVDRLQADLAALPPFHVPEFNDAVAQLTGALSELDALLAELEPYLETYGSIKDALSSLVP